MTEVKTGDKIRVVIEAEVTDWATQAAAVAANGGELVSLEVLPKRLQVGDELTCQDDYARAPIGTVAKDALSGGLIFKNTQNWWISTDGTGGQWNWELGGNRTIVYLPDVA